VARWHAGHHQPDALALFLDAFDASSGLRLGSVRSIVAGVAAGSLATLDPAAARSMLLKLVDVDVGDLLSPNDIVRIATGTVLYRRSSGDHDAARDLLSRIITLPGRTWPRGGVRTRAGPGRAADSLHPP
jgi:hypothetical protein